MMDRTQLQAEHPELVTALVQEGVNQERDRVGAFMTAGEMSGNMKTACAAIKDGSEMTQTLSMQFMMAGVNRGNIDQRAEDDEAADPGEAAPKADDKATAQVGFEAIMLAAGNACGVSVEV